MFQVDNVSVNYGKSKIVSDVSFHLEEGSKLAVLGRNGVGKTTLIKCLIGILPVVGNGIIYLDEVNLTKCPSYQHNLAGIGYVPQGREIIPDLSVSANLDLGAMGHRDIDIKMQKELVLAYFPSLIQHLHRKGGLLSGGQQQQLAIARCLMGKPKVILLDEPTEGIQPNIVTEIASILNRIVKEMKLSIILVEQNLGFSRRIADNYIVLQKGRIVSEGKIEELTDEMAKHYLAV